MSDTALQPLRVFLCHASEDKPTVRELHQRLKTEDWIDAWLDEDHLLLGEDWDTKIQKELESADIVVVFISDASMKKIGYVQKELRLIYDISLYKPEDTIFVIPLRLEECQPPWRFRLWQWGNYFGEKKETTYQKLLMSLKQRHQQKLQSQAKEQVNREAESVSRKAKEKKISKYIEEHIQSEDLFLENLSHLHVRDRQLPSVDILLTDQNTRPDERMINRTAGMIEKTLVDFGISATVIGFRSGPSVIQFVVQPSFRRRGEITRITSLQKDLALALAVEHLRIEAPVPGKPYIGIEIPNYRKNIVRLRSILETDAFHKMGSQLAIALGRDVSGHPVIENLVRMPHMLIAGTTGSGKSECITAMAACLAMNNSPEDLCMVMIDSRMGGLSRFNGLPHLYWKVETNIERVLGVLRWLIIEMEHRYRLFESAHVNGIEKYNRGIGSISPIPRIVVFIDELADLMMSAPDRTEKNLVRLAQMAHATGIHLIVTTQRPSADVLTKSIKTYFHARLSFAVTSGVDSRVILDMTGAEDLLGQGDMLFLKPELHNPRRVQSSMVTDVEIERLIAHWQKVVDVSVEVPPWEQLLTEPERNQDEDLIEKAIAIVRQSHHASASMLQRRLRIGYPRAARLLDQLEGLGIIGSSQGGGKEREVLLKSIESDSPNEKGESSN